MKLFYDKFTWIREGLMELPLSMYATVAPPVLPPKQRGQSKYAKEEPTLIFGLGQLDLGSHAYVLGYLVENVIVQQGILFLELFSHLVRPTVSDKQSWVFPHADAPTTSVISSENKPPAHNHNESHARSQEARRVRFLGDCVPPRSLSMALQPVKMMHEFSFQSSSSSLQEHISRDSFTK